MAQRRMFSKRVVSSARFLQMSASAQALYFHLCMDADDDGVVEAFTVMRLVKAMEDDFKVLIAKKFIVPLNEDLVSVILDWSEHNLIRADRKVNSIYRELLVSVLPDISVKEPKPRADTGVIPRQLATGRPLDRIGKDRLGKDRLEQRESATAEPLQGIPEVFKVFEEINPSIQRMYGNTTQRKSAESLIKQFGLDATLRGANAAVLVQGQPYAPRISTPYQLETKWSDLVAFMKEYKAKDKDKPKLYKLK